MTVNRWVLVLAILWVISFAAAFVHSDLAAATGSGFVRGMNKLLILVVWQILALLVAVVVLVVRLANAKALATWAKWLGLIPIVVSASLWALVIGVVALEASRGGELPAQPNRTPTAPAGDAIPVPTPDADRP